MSLVPMGGNKLIADPDLIESNAQRLHRDGHHRRDRRAAVRRSPARSRTSSPYHSHQQGGGGDRGRQVQGRDRPARRPGPATTASGGSFAFDTDEGPRADTTVEGLAKLKPVFDPKGTVTAGNASQINDGAAVVVVMSRREGPASWACQPIAFVRDWAVAGVPPDIMGIGPAKAVPKLLAKTGLTLAGHRPRRDQRGVRLPVGLLRAGARPRPREDQRQRRRDRHRPPARRHRRDADRASCSASSSAATRSAASSPCASAAGWASPTCSRWPSTAVRSSRHHAPAAKAGALSSSQACRPRGDALT